MNRLTRDGTAEPVSRDQILRHERGQGSVHFPCSADHEQDWQPYPVDPYSTICDDHTYIHRSTGKVASSARGQLNMENEYLYISLSPIAPENLVSRDGFGRPAQRQPAHSPHSG